MSSDWVAYVREKERGEPEDEGMQPFRLKGATEKQVDTIREFAEKQGFKDLRGFATWMKSLEITYYDVLRWGSP